MSYVGESSASQEIREPLLPERSSASVAAVAAPGMYQDNHNYGNPYGPMAVLRRWLGIFSYKVITQALVAPRGAALAAVAQQRLPEIFLLALMMTQ